MGNGALTSTQYDRYSAGCWRAALSCWCTVPVFPWCNEYMACISLLANVLLRGAILMEMRIHDMFWTEKTPTLSHYQVVETGD